MKTFETEKHNIPEGATHCHDECEDYFMCWFKLVNSEWFVCCPEDGSKGWVKCKAEHKRSGFKRIPEKKEALDAIEQVEWNGEGLPPIGVECEMIFDGKGELITPLYFTEFVDGLVLFYHSSSSKPHCDDTYGWCLVENCIFRKPESPEAKKEREELELINEVSEMLNVNGFGHDKLLLKCLISHKYLYRKGE